MLVLVNRNDVKLNNECGPLYIQGKKRISITVFIIIALSLGFHFKPNILIRSRFALTAIELKTLKNTTAVISGRGGAAMDIDTVEKNLYFQDGNSISRFNLNDEKICVKVILKDARASDMAFDWIGRRIFWTGHTEKRIFRANLIGKEKNVLVKTTGKPYGIALDPWRR